MQIHLSKNKLRSEFIMEMEMFGSEIKPINYRGLLLNSQSFHYEPNKAYKIN